jgi:hypothetical protein
LVTIQKQEDLKKSIALGTQVVNTAANQFMVGSATFDGAIYELSLGNNDVETSPLIFANLTGVGLGTTTPTRDFDVYSDSINPVARFGNQNGYCEIDPTNTALVCTSDQSLKKDVTDIHIGIDVIAQLRAVTYRWNNEASTTTPHFGFIAQEVESVIPELVTTDSRTGLKSVAYTGIIPILTQAIVDLDKSLGGTSATSSTESFISSKIWDKITSAFEWLGVKIQNGLVTMKDLIADTVFAKEVETEKLCISENGEKFCISKDDLRQLKDLIGSTTSNNINTPVVEENNNTDIIVEGESAPDPISPDETSPLTEETPSDTVSDTTSPVEETTPVVEPVTESAPTGEPAPVLEP